MKTVVDNLNRVAEELHNLMAELLLKHSGLYRRGREIFSVNGNHAYIELKENGRVLQSKLLEKYRRFNAIIRCLLREQPKDTIEALKDSETIVERTIEQDTTWCETTEEASQKAAAALQIQIELLRRLYDHSGGEASYVSDTNALIYNPKLESWKFAESPKFTIILMPSVLSELDSHKNNHRNPTVRKKAETLIRQIKEYRRRGKLTEGVPILSGKINLVAIATEPRDEFFLPWFDSSVKDDRILASTLEAMRRRPNSAVVLVTRDINLQNKAELAHIPFVEPPDP